MKTYLILSTCVKNANRWEEIVENTEDIKIAAKNNIISFPLFVVTV